MARLSIFIAYLAGLLGLLPSLAIALVTAAVAWVGLRFITQLLQLLMS